MILPPRLWKRHGAGGRAPPRFRPTRMAANASCGVGRKTSKTMRLNEEGEGKGRFLPREFVLLAGDDHPE